jgi:FkbM family methyltransferase
MRLLLVDTSNDKSILDFCFFLKQKDDLVIYTKTPKFEEYNLDTISYNNIINAITCNKPDIVILYGTRNSINDNIKLLTINRPNKFFIISVIKDNNDTADTNTIENILKNSIKILCYDKSFYETIKNTPSKEVIYADNNETVFTNLLDNIRKKNNPFEIVARPTKYGTMAYVKNDYYFIDDLVTRSTIYEADIIESELKDTIIKSKYIYDIGAHSGSHTMVYSYFNPDAIIHTFEPQTIMYKTILFNVNTNKRHRVRPYNVALGKEVGILNLSKSITDGPNQNMPIDTTSNQYYNLGGMQIGTDGEKVVCDILDNYDYGGCDFIKLDVEGFEGLVLQGGINLIKKYKPVIFFESNYKTVKPEVIELLKIKPEDLDTFSILKSIGYKNFKKCAADNYLTYYECN